MSCSTASERTCDARRTAAEDEEAELSCAADAYYSDLNLVIGYHERQHTSSVPHFDKRKTISGVGRGEQRKLYDDRRKIVLPKHGLRLVVFDHSEFKCTGTGRLFRDKSAEKVIAERLSSL